MNYKVFNFVSLYNMAHDFLLFFINTQNVLSITFDAIKFWSTSYWTQLTRCGKPITWTNPPNEIPLNLVTNWLLTPREERLICDYGLFDSPSLQSVNDAKSLYSFSTNIQMEINTIKTTDNFNVSLYHLHACFVFLAI